MVPYYFNFNMTYEYVNQIDNIKGNRHLDEVTQNYTFLVHLHIFDQL